MTSGSPRPESPRLRAYHRRLAREQVMGGGFLRWRLWSTCLVSAGLCAWKGLQDAEGLLRIPWLLAGVTFAFLPFGLRRGWTWLRWPAAGMYAAWFVAGLSRLVETGSTGESPARLQGSVDLLVCLGFALYFLSRTSERELRAAYGPEEDEADGGGKPA